MKKKTYETFRRYINFCFLQQFVFLIITPKIAIWLTNEKCKYLVFHFKKFTAPLLIIFVCYVMITHIFKTVTSHTRTIMTSSVDRLKKDKDRNLMLMWITVKAVLAFVCGWTPYAAIVVLASLGQVSSIKKTFL